MGRAWDHGVPGVEFWKEALRVAKPGAHLLSFGGTRTFHRIACAIEDAGWEVRDCIMWLYGSGFPKSMDISKAIDKKLGAERTEVVGTRHRNVKPFDDGNGWNSNNTTGDYQYMAPASEEAKKWSGWGTCLKPAYEPIIMARKPVEGTIVDNVLKHGTGGINIDECRIPFESEEDRKSTGMDRIHTSKVGAFAGKVENDHERTTFMPRQTNGRFPANVLHDGSDEVVELFPDNVKGGTWNNTKGARHFENNGKPTEYTNKGSDNSVGSAARFFYCAKASKKERGEGNVHPTVKPIALMEYLVKLVAPENAIVLDPFMGSGTTGVASVNLGRGFVGIEKEKEYFDIAERRIENAEKKEDKTNEEPTGKDGEADRVS
jgi:site-specific DNA-methyltransferase (adenine-specific)